MQPKLLDELVKAVRPAKVSVKSEDLSTWGQDWTRFFDPKPLAIVFPTKIEQLINIIRIARKHRIGLVPSGGRTGLSGGAVAQHEEIVVSFDKMNKIKDFNPIDQTLTCQSGVITQQIQDYASNHGLFYPVDFASSGSSQIGGNISTNAGGIKVIRYGMTRDQVIGVKVVTGKGDVLELNNGLLKNNTGYDLRQIFIGAEGTLGFIVEATLKLVRPPENLKVLLLAVLDISKMMTIVTQFRNRINVTAVEFFSDKALSLVVASGAEKKPLDNNSSWYLLLEYEALTSETDERAMEEFEDYLEKGLVTDGVISQNETQFIKLWRCRELISEVISKWSPYKCDLSIKPSKIPEFLEHVEKTVSDIYPDFTIIWFGHIGDGNLHLNILKPEYMEASTFLDVCEKTIVSIFNLVKQYQGSISAEHGIGILKKKYLKYSRTTDEIYYMKQIKNIFDPDNILNPGKIFDCEQTGLP